MQSETKMRDRTKNKVRDFKISKPKHQNARPYKRDKYKNYEV